MENVEMQYEKLSNLLSEVVKFTNEHKIDVKINIFSISELKEDSDEIDDYWAKFEKYAGTYCFFNIQKKTIDYIGMSKSDTGARISNWLFADSKVIANLTNEDLVLLISYPEQYYMAPALESYLIQKFSPILNKTK